MLTLKHITKTYPGVVALNDVSITFEQGEVHALLGENGAGKSTLIKIIAGAIEPDAGTIGFDQREFQRMTPKLASENGVAVIYQELNLCGPLSVAENIFLGRPQTALYSQKKCNALACELFAEYGFDLNPAAQVMSLPPAQQQLVEICKAISMGATIMIMDEPTSSLATHEAELLFQLIKKLKERGVTVIYISHRLDEVFQVTDRVSILRDGCYVTTKNTAETTRQQLVNFMVGRDLKESFPRRTNPIGEVILRAEHITGNSVEDISFELHRGEILGFAGLVGCGRTETAQLICGARKIESGKLIVKGSELKLKSPTDALAAGIGLIPEDRKEQGCILFNTVMFNETLICLKDLCKFGVINAKKRREVAQHFREALSIRIPSLNQMVINLSGGNQQKVIVAKALAANLDVLFFDEPTKGIDVGAKQEIYHLMNEMVAQGKAIVMISSDMEEILGMSDRILVLYEGRITGEIIQERFSQERILTLASGMEE
ncbi:MAG: sugar ABC transporter ATP-binding protein [Clostridiaceae bacterium]